MNWSNQCHKSVWIYYYYYYYYYYDWQRDSSVHDVNYESFDSILFWIEVKRVKRFQFNAVWMMLEHCMIRKVIMQSFHSCDNILSNCHNQFTKKINDMLMSVRDEKILLVKKTIQMKSLRIVITSDRKIYDSSTTSILKRLHHINNIIK